MAPSGDSQKYLTLPPVRLPHSASKSRYNINIVFEHRYHQSLYTNQYVSPRRLFICRYAVAITVAKWQHYSRDADTIQTRCSIISPETVACFRDFIATATSSLAFESIKQQCWRFTPQNAINKHIFIVTIILSKSLCRDYCHDISFCRVDPALLVHRVPNATSIGTQVLKVAMQKCVYETGYCIATKGGCVHAA